MNKLKNFPSVICITLEQDIQRQDLIISRFNQYEIKPYLFKSKKYTQSNDIITGKYEHQVNGPTKGCIVSHLKALKEWYETTNESYLFVCEDDLSLDTVSYWNFTWNDFIDSLTNDWDIVQLQMVRDEFTKTNFHVREWNSWGATAYIIKRHYAKKIIDTYIKNDTYHLEIPNSDVMPINENILYTVLGKAYSVPLFIEDIGVSSTHTEDKELKGGQKPNHVYSSNFILQWWKENQADIKTIMNISTDPLVAYAYDTENAIRNFELARWYHKRKQTASAITYYLRAADRTEDSLLAYECLLHMASCFHDQKNRNYTVKGLYQHAINLLPKRPEAYFLLSRHEEWNKMYSDSYTIATLGLNVCDFDLEPLTTFTDYPGKYGLIFEKAVCSYWWGKSQECRDLFQDLKNNYELDKTHYDLVAMNLQNLGCWIPKSIKYEKSKYEEFKYKFPGLENIEKSNGQALQDMFILSILNGKRNGTYLEIGAQEPIFQNNSAILEKDFGWKGVSIEILENLCKMFAEQRSNPIICKDATTIDYEKLLNEHYTTKEIDYLQLDCEPSKTTFEILLSIPFEQYKFAVITYEHDHYVDMTGTYRTKSRNYLKSCGYELVVANVSQNDKTPFEDWWVHPDLVDSKTIKKFKSIKEVTDVRDYFYQ
jgi:GR25 family glycosyltransferase involved in LPS biosynthesis